MTRIATIPATVHGRYLVGGDRSSRVLVGFHGYAESAEDQFERLEAVRGSAAWRVIAIQGLHSFYQRRTKHVVASWMTHQDRELAIRDNIAYTASVLDEALDGQPPEVIVFAGFSQGVAMAFRAAAAFPHASPHVVAVGGDVPPELDGARLTRIASAVICRGADDPYYAAETFDRDVARLAAAAVPVEAQLVPGGHAWTEDVSVAVSRFLFAL